MHSLARSTRSNDLFHAHQDTRIQEQGTLTEAPCRCRDGHLHRGCSLPHHTTPSAHTFHERATLQTCCCESCLRPSGPSHCRRRQLAGHIGASEQASSSTFFCGQTSEAAEWLWVIIATGLSPPAARWLSCVRPWLAPFSVHAALRQVYAKGPASCVLRHSRATLPSYPAGSACSSASPHRTRPAALTRPEVQSRHRCAFLPCLGPLASAECCASPRGQSGVGAGARAREPERSWSAEIEGSNCVRTASAAAIQSWSVCGEVKFCEFSCHAWSVALSS